MLPNTFFLHIVHLTILELNFFLPADFVSENLSLLTQAASKKVAPMASQTVIDWCVWNIEPCAEISQRTESIFLPFLCRLRFLEICLELTFPTVDDLKNLVLIGFTFHQPHNSCYTRTPEFQHSVLFF